MQSRYSLDDTHKIRIWMAVFGALSIVAFLFAPLPSISSTAGSSIYMVDGSGEQWGMLLLALLAFFLMYFRQSIWACAAATGVLLTTMPLVWRYVKSGLLSPVLGRHHVSELSPLQVKVLFIGVVLLLAASCWGVWCEWKDKQHDARSRAVMAPRWFDPRTVNPHATVGYCYNCGAKNPLSRNQCLQCSVNLSWFVSSPVSPKPQRTQSKQDFFAMPSIIIDWAALGIGIISFILWPLGLVLFFAYSKTDEEKANAAVFGACLALLIIVIRFIYIMATAGH